MSKFSTKAVAAGVSVATAAWLSGAAMFVPVAGAQTTADLQAQITALLAQITALQAQLGASTSTYSYTRNLTVGSTGADVKALQTWLNANGYPVAATGAGSVGNESTYFGAKTKAALAKYQAAKGISPAVGYFGPVTRASLAAAAPAPGTPGTPSTGVEGSLSSKLAPTPADLTEVKEGNSDVAVVGYEVKAKDNDVTLSRVDLNFNKRPWLSWNDVSLWDGSTLLQRFSSLKSTDFDEVTSATDYRLRFSGFTLLIKKGETKTLTLKVSAPSNSESGSVNIAITANANSFRGTDPTGKTQDAPSAALTARTARFLDKDTGDVELAVANTNPKERVVQVSDSGTTEIELMQLSLKAKNQDISLKTLKVGTLTTTENIASTTDTLKLYDGSTVVGTATPDAITGSSSFTDLSDKVKITKDTSKVLTVKAVVKKQAATNYSVGAALSSTINANGADVSAEDANFSTATVSGSAVTGGIQRLYVKAPVLTLLSQSVTAQAVSSSEIVVRGNGKMRVAVKAVGGDIYVYKHSTTNQASSGFDATSTVVGVTPTTTFTSVADSNATDGTAAESKTFTWYIPQNQTKVFEVGVVFQTGVGATSGNFNGNIKRFLWTTADTILVGPGTVSASPFLQSWGLSDFKTSDVFLQGS